MIKKISIFGILLMSFSIMSFAQKGAAGLTALLTGPNPAWEGSTARYTLAYQGRTDPGLNFVSSVTNGTIIDQNINPYNGQALYIRITWNCLVSSGNITITETTTGYTYTYNVTLWTYGNYVPFAKNCVLELQDVTYGDIPTPLSVDNCSPFCTSSYDFTYQWQISDYDPSVFPIQYNWSSIPGATADTYTPDPMFNYGSKAYRRVTSFHHTIAGFLQLVVIESDPAVVRFEAHLTGAYFHAGLAK